MKEVARSAEFGGSRQQWPNRPFRIQRPDIIAKVFVANGKRAERLIRASTWALKKCSRLVVCARIELIYHGRGRLYFV